MDVAHYFTNVIIVIMLVLPAAAMHHTLHVTGKAVDLPLITTLIATVSLAALTNRILTFLAGVTPVETGELFSHELKVALLALVVVAAQTVIISFVIPFAAKSACCLAIGMKREPDKRDLFDFEPPPKQTSVLALGGIAVGAHAVAALLAMGAVTWPAALLTVKQEKQSETEEIATASAAGAAASMSRHKDAALATAVHAIKIDSNLTRLRRRCGAGEAACLKVNDTVQTDYAVLLAPYKIVKKPKVPLLLSQFDLGIDPMITVVLRSELDKFELLHALGRALPAPARVDAPTAAAVVTVAPPGATKRDIAARLERSFAQLTPARALATVAADVSTGLAVIGELIAMVLVWVTMLVQHSHTRGPA